MMFFPLLVSLCWAYIGLEYNAAWGVILWLYCEQAKMTSVGRRIVWLYSEQQNDTTRPSCGPSIAY